MKALPQCHDNAYKLLFFPLTFFHVEGEEERAGEYPVCSVPIQKQFFNLSNCIIHLSFAGLDFLLLSQNRSLSYYYLIHFYYIVVCSMEFCFVNITKNAMGCSSISLLDKLLSTNSFSQGMS